jgi:hypothetical protein
MPVFYFLPEMACYAFCYNKCYNKVYKSLIFSRSIFDFGFVITKFCAKNSL